MLIDDRDVGIVESRHGEGEIQSTRPNNFAESFQARRYLVAFPPRYDRLCLTETASELDLGETGAQPGLFDEIATDHVPNIVQICYILEIDSSGARRHDRRVVGPGKWIPVGPSVCFQEASDSIS